MKRVLISVLFAASCLVARSDEPYRVFTDLSGRSLSARMTSYDARKQVVSVLLENGRAGKLPLAQLSEADRQYVQTWLRFQDFFDERKFLIECDDEDAGSSKEEIRQDITFEDGDSEYVLYNVIRKKKIAYEFIFSNRTEAPLDGLRMEYRIYYAQSTMTTDATNPVSKQYVSKGSMKIPKIEKRKQVALTTRAVEVYWDDLNALVFPGGDRRQGGVGEVLGVRARIFMKLDSGEERMREFHYPDALPEEEYPWGE
jgi:hypothetical protein